MLLYSAPEALKRFSLW